MRSIYVLLLGAAATVSAALNSSSSVPWANLTISAPVNGRYLYRTSNDEPFFWQADTAWELFHRLNRSDADFYLQDRASKGFNVVQAVAIAELNGTTWPNFLRRILDGDLPLIDKDPMKPNEAYFEYIDWVVNRAAEYGILIALVPTWGAYMNCGWYNQSWVIFNHTSAEWYGNYIGTRYPGLPKIIGADSNGFWSCNISEASSEWEADPSLDQASLVGPIRDWRSVFARLADGLREAEAKKGFTSFIAWHPTNVQEIGTDKPYGHNYMNGSFGRLSMDAVQSGHTLADHTSLAQEFYALQEWDSTKNYNNITEMRAAFPGPVIDLENHYEGAHIAFNASLPLWNTSIVRHGLWNAFLSGSAGFTYGAQAVWQMYAPESELAYSWLYMPPRLTLAANESWRDALKYPGSTQAGYLQQLFSGLDKEMFNSLQPNRTFIKTPGSSDGDILSYQANRYVAALVGLRQYWLYTGFGDAFDLDLDALGQQFGEVKGEAKSEWFDPRTGKAQNTTSSFQLSGRKTFEPPTGGSVDNDWAFVLTLVPKIFLDLLELRSMRKNTHLNY
ncbi:hypothetical protein M406DRAFT_332167 [Cryphonectria parasitica EP155]|uniref:DUF4038 domain-containing protein n=1 Tax=Cryphonectria parasitica (strain ATCC 38755 / EP155) TaxID=660469 RepID=A0A9P4XZD8_CRYP1|nr:uncharacterized protein M406DRAFT_332167 [Cryphonectria parasitica EP155]KAF3763706.1 hypothetical protein M406DRAFT_332167 [Cryphonectria parasitica EP155]